MRTSAAQAFLLALFLTGCATGTATRSVSTHSVQNSDATKSVTPASIEYVELPFGSSNYCVFAEGRQILVESRDILGLSDDLPLNIRMRQAMVDANAKEWKAVLVFAGMEPSTPLDQHAGMVGGLDTVKGMLTYFQASDGIEFLVDNHAMALWYRSVKGPWTCVVSGVNVVKPLGGNYPHLPVCYAGAKRFLVAETLPGRIAADQGGPELKAHCATFLIDCGTGRVIERSEAVTYSYNPPLVLPREWKENRDQGRTKSFTKTGSAASVSTLNRRDALHDYGRLRTQSSRQPRMRLSSSAALQSEPGGVKLASVKQMRG